jgi:hypothetical protein
MGSLARQSTRSSTFDMWLPAVARCQPGERVIPPFEVDREAVIAVHLNHGGDRCAELVATVPAGEQVDVLAGPPEKADCPDRVSAGQGEAVSLSGRETRAGEPFVKGIHQLRGVRAGSGEFWETFFPAPPELRWQPEHGPELEKKFSVEPGAQVIDAASLG